MNFLKAIITNHKLLFLFLIMGSSFIFALYSFNNIVLLKMYIEKNTRADIFNRYSTTEDNDSPVLVPRENTLSRRSALSSRSTSGGRRRRSMTGLEINTKNSVNSQLESEEAVLIPPGGITLYDRPVSMSEWIDLGDASLFNGNNNLFSRVHDRVWVNTPPPAPPPHTEKTSFALYPSPPSASILQSPSPTSVLTPPPPDQKQQIEQQTAVQAEPRKRRKSIKQSVKRKKSWIANLFQQQGNNRETIASSPSDQPNNKKIEKKGLGSLISRSLTLPSRKKRLQSSQEPLSASVPSTDPNFILFQGHERLPLHTERAIYRLSHIKLTNPRRPLYQQVLISNFMFAYLSLQPGFQYYRQQQQEQRSQFTSSSPLHNQPKNGTLNSTTRTAITRPVFC
ncbi:activator of mitotic machinery Cdc14 phosphatase activation C-term-domain-containing protein [Circinella umbellata]|nr:activator of mitotic machinery Cdc14 phosphatase activation C-term-domain-containing protein [Circinella umbellata]